jgi:hypothetical protein
MDRADATTLEFCAARQMPEQCPSASVEDGSTHLKRFVRLGMFVGVVGLSIFLGHKFYDLIGNVAKETGAQMHRFNIVSLRR